MELLVALADRGEVRGEELGAGDLLPLEQILRALRGESQRVDRQLYRRAAP